MAGPTCLPSSGRPSKIDDVLANGAAAEQVVSAGLRRDLGLATQSALEVELGGCPMSLAGPASDKWPAARQAVTNAVVREHGKVFRDALRGGQLGAAWGALGAAMRQWLNLRMGHHQPLERQYLHQMAG